MSMEFVNRICPNCKNPNYMVLLGDFSKAFKYKCINCNGYFNDIDFEKKSLQPAWKNECMNTKVDMVEVVRCKNCRHGYKCKNAAGEDAVECLNHYVSLESICRQPDWFCADGEHREGL